MGLGFHFSLEDAKWNGCNFQATICNRLSKPSNETKRHRNLSRVVLRKTQSERQNFSQRTTIHRIGVYSLTSHIPLRCFRHVLTMIMRLLRAGSLWTLSSLPIVRRMRVGVRLVFARAHTKTSENKIAKNRNWWILLYLRRCTGCGDAIWWVISAMKSNVPH